MASSDTPTSVRELLAGQRLGYGEAVRVLFAVVFVLFAIEAVDQLFYGGELFRYGVRRADWEHWHRILQHR